MARGFGARESGPYGEAGYGKEGPIGPSYSDPDVRPFMNLKTFGEKFAEPKAGADQVFELANGALTKVITTIDNPAEMSFSTVMGAKNGIEADALKEKAPELFSLVNSKEFLDSLEEGARQRATEEYSNWKDAKYQAEQWNENGYAERATQAEAQNFDYRMPFEATYSPLGVVAFTDSTGTKQSWAYHSYEDVNAKLDYGWEQSEDDVTGRDYLEEVELKSTPEQIFSSLRFVRLK